MDAEDVEVRILVDAFLDVGVEAKPEFFVFLLRFGGVDYFCALGFWHCGRGCPTKSQDGFWLSWGMPRGRTFAPIPLYGRWLRVALLAVPS